jgi:hypothetical protein
VSGYLGSFGGRWGQESGNEGGPSSFRSKTLDEDHWRARSSEILGRVGSQALQDLDLRRTRVLHYRRSSHPYLGIVRLNEVGGRIAYDPWCSLPGTMAMAAAEYYPHTLAKCELTWLLPAQKRVAHDHRADSSAMTRVSRDDLGCWMGSYRKDTRS